ncbi:hypothetical protein KUTeg_012690 [Tegillarca granosa]|uniref:Uncharacterized protein n=1 Tax=Tegillarca granosa TaxID=220873 RepID=A0ABQ9F3T1_TEGGR|nr:hypothetical protein KUTeg_012690 [Tegillarca granosa]
MTTFQSSYLCQLHFYKATLLPFYPATFVIMTTFLSISFLVVMTSFLSSYIFYCRNYISVKLHLWLCFYHAVIYKHYKTVNKIISCFALSSLALQ